MKDFFISYTQDDKRWAEWIAWQLKDAGYSVVLQAWDFAAGHDFILKMDTASKETKHTLIVLSPAFLKASYTQLEWAAALQQDIKGEKRRLIPVKVLKCNPRGLLGPIAYISLVGLGEAAARKRLLNGVKPPAPPATPPPFPGP